MRKPQRGERRPNKVENGKHGTRRTKREIEEQAAHDEMWKTVSRIQGNENIFRQDKRNNSENIVHKTEKAEHEEIGGKRRTWQREMKETNLHKGEITKVEQTEETGERREEQGRHKRAKGGITGKSEKL